MWTKMLVWTLYAAFATAGASLAAHPLRDSARVLLSPWSWAPQLLLPLVWLALGLWVGLSLASILMRAFQGQRVGVWRFAALILSSATLGGAGKWLRPLRALHPQDALVEQISRVEQAADAFHAEFQRYPTPEEPRWERSMAALPVLDLGFFAQGGRRLTTRVVTRAGADAAPMVPDAESRPGDVLFVTDADQQRYWIVAWTLEDGRPALLRDSRGRAPVATGAKGHPGAPEDPHWVDYPHKLPVAEGRMPGGDPAPKIP